MLELKELNQSEKARIYHYKDGNKFKIENVTHFLDSNSTHRLKTQDGHLWIIPKENILAIELITDNFTL